MNKITLDQLIKGMNRSELVKLIYKMTQSSGAAEQVLLDYCQENTSLEYKSIVVEKQIKKHWNNAYRIIADANTYGGCSDSDEDDAIYEIDLITKLIEGNEVSWACRKEILDETLEQIAYDNSGFTDSLVDTAIAICHTEDEKVYLADYLSKEGSGYYKGIAASMYNELGMDAKYLEIKKANLAYGSDYLELAYYYEKRNQKDIALKFALDGFDRCDGRLDEIYRYLFQVYERKNDEKAIWDLYQKAQKKKRNLDCITELMYQYCKERNGYENQKEMLLSLVRCCYHAEIAKWYKQCAADLSEADWKSKEPEVLSSVKDRNLSVYLDICLEKGNTMEVLEHVQKKSGYLGWENIDYDHRYSKILAKSHPNEIVELYWKEASGFINLGKDKNYHHAVSALKEIRSIMRKNKQTDMWNRQFNELKEQHKRKRNLMKAIDERM